MSPIFVARALRCRDSGPHGPRGAEGVADTTSKRLEGVRPASAREKRPQQKIGDISRLGTVDGSVAKFGLIGELSARVEANRRACLRCRTVRWDRGHGMATGPSGRRRRLNRLPILPGPFASSSSLQPSLPERRVRRTVVAGPSAAKRRSTLSRSNRRAPSRR